MSCQLERAEDGRPLLGSKNWLYVDHGGGLGVEQEHFAEWAS